MSTRTRPFLPNRPASPIRSIRCTHGCGYVRQYTDAAWYLSRMIDHLIYGRVTGEELVRKDMWNHDCEWHLNRQRRTRDLSGYTGRVYRSGPA